MLGEVSTVVLVLEDGLVVLEAELEGCSGQMSLVNASIRATFVIPAGSKFAGVGTGFAGAGAGTGIGALDADKDASIVLSAATSSGVFWTLDNAAKRA